MTHEQIAYFLEAVLSMSFHTECTSIGRKVTDELYYYKFKDSHDDEFAIWMRPNSIGVTGAVFQWWEELAHDIGHEFGLAVQINDEHPVWVPLVSHENTITIH